MIKKRTISAWKKYRTWPLLSQVALGTILLSSVAFAGRPTSAIITEQRVVNYETEYIDDPTKESTFKEVVEPGLKGEETVKTKMKKVAGLVVNKEEISRKRLKNPKSVLIKRGLIVVNTITVDEAIPFQTTFEDNSFYNVGYVSPKTAGSNGIKKVTYTIKTLSGKEIERKATGEVVKTAPTNAVTIRGTRKPIAPTYPAWGEGDLDCSDLSYDEAQDVLAEDSSDPNGLDGDGDGEACEWNS